MFHKTDVRTARIKYIITPSPFSRFSSPPSPLSLAPRIFGLWAFFFAILRSLPSISDRAAAAHAAIHGPVLTLFVPARLGFTYVQTALLAVAAAHELLRRDKDFYYDVAAVAINLPVGFVAWLEAVACARPRRQLMKM